MKLIARRYTGHYSIVKMTKGKRKQNRYEVKANTVSALLEKLFFFTTLLIFEGFPSLKIV
jgi:hypothetical protein